jgi:hypothetical protein
MCPECESSALTSMCTLLTWPAISLRQTPVSNSGRCLPQAQAGSGLLLAADGALGGPCEQHTRIGPHQPPGGTRLSGISRRAGNSKSAAVTRAVIRIHSIDDAGGVAKSTCASPPHRAPRRQRASARACPSSEAVAPGAPAPSAAPRQFRRASRTTSSRFDSPPVKTSDCWKRMA